MHLKVKEFAQLTGVSVRTLHYYDEIGLLLPSVVDNNTGYRFYDNDSLFRMQEILFYRELDFPLKTIKEILSSPNYNKETALKDQKKLLILKKQHLERLILAIDDAVKGENVMQVFNDTELEKYKNEAKERWGKSNAYAEYVNKTKNYSDKDFQKLGMKIDNIFAEFAKCMKEGELFGCDKVQQLVNKLKNSISENCYNCTNEILAQLGQMYVIDKRFKNNIDKYGAGTADFVSDAIIFFCDNN